MFIKISLTNKFKIYMQIRMNFHCKFTDKIKYSNPITLKKNLLNKVMKNEIILQNKDLY